MSFNTIAQNTNQSISDARNYADDRVDAILQPKTAQGINGFLFDIPREENIELNSDVTDHFTEDNSFINDHVVNRPIEVTLTGFHGELLFERPSGIAGAAQQLQNRLETVEAYLGERTPGFIQQTQDVVNQTQNAITTINQTIDRVQNVVGLFEGAVSLEETRQGQAYAQLNTLRENKIPVTLQTPWTYFDNMIITNISFIQPENSADISEISVTLKEFRVAEVRTRDFSDNSAPSRNDIQSTDPENVGQVRGERRDISFLEQGIQNVQAGLPFL